MPHIVIRLSGPVDTTLARRAVEAVADLTVDILGKAREVIATEVGFVADDQWYIAGRSLAEWQRSAFQLDISVTDETNTKTEKARYLAAIHAAFRGLRPDLHEICYVHIIDARAAAYGYGGRSQEFRHQAAAAAAREVPSVREPQTV